MFFTDFKNLFILSLFILIGCQPGKKPNVVFILTDQWRASAFGCSGNNIVKTPEIDKLASAAVNFSNTVSVCPVCTPYRASLLTGRFPTSTGMFLNDIYLPAHELCMAEIYKEAGYQTAYLGKWHLDGHGRSKSVAPGHRQGFDYWKGSECDHDYNNEHYYENDDPAIKHWKGYSPFAISNEAQSYMEKHASDENPFILFVSIATPHYPHNTAPKEYQSLYPDEKLQLPPNVPDSLREKVFSEMRGYYGHCTATDKAIGEIIQKMKSLGIYENSIVVFTSDHGEMMGAHGRKPKWKQLFWNESSQVPLLISYPGIGASRGTVNPTPVTTPDILPSLLGLSAIPVPGTIEGENLSSLMREGKKDEERAALFMNVCPFGANASYKDPEFRAMRTGRYAYMKTPDGKCLLFDNNEDPYQLNNLAGKVEFADLQIKLDSQLNRELEKVGDLKFKSREFYLKKWGLKLNDRNFVTYYFNNEKDRIIQSPKRLDD